MMRIVGAALPAYRQAGVAAWFGLSACAGSPQRGSPTTAGHDVCFLGNFSR